MPQESYTTIAYAGLFFVNVSNLEPVFAIKYFLPLYDQQIDPSIHTDPLSNVTSANYTSAVDFEPLSHSTLVGEKIFNLSNSVSSYSYSPDSSYVYNLATATTGTSGISATTQSQATYVNLLNGLPMSNVVSGTDPSHTGNGNFTFGSGITEIAGVSDAVTAADRNYLFDQIRYNPITSSTGEINGMFKCILPNNIGDFKFNKIALYLQRLNSSGNVITDSAPTLFAVVALNQVVTKTSHGSSNSIQQFELDVQLDFTTNVESGANTAFFSTDDWIRVPIGLDPSSATQGLFFANDVAIGTSAGADGSWNARAHLHITDADKAQLRLSNDYDNNSLDFTVDSNGLTTIDSSATTHPLIAFGTSNTVSGAKSSVFGINNTVSGDYSYVNGRSNVVRLSDDSYVYGHNNEVIAESDYSNFIMGQYNTCRGSEIIMLGDGNVAYGRNSFAMGLQCHTSGTRSYAMGFTTTATGTGAVTMGQSTKAEGALSMALGYQTTATGDYTIALGYQTSAGRSYSFAGGNSTRAEGTAAVSFGTSTSAIGNNSLSTGNAAYAYGNNSFAVGTLTSAIGDNSLVYGYSNHAISGTGVGGYLNSIVASNSFSFGEANSATSGKNALLFGYNNLFNTAENTLTFGNSNIAYGNNSFVGGSSNINDTSVNSFMMGNNNRIFGDQACALGSSTTARGDNSLVFGNNTSAGAVNSFAGGYLTRATGDKSVALGAVTTASGENSVSLGNLSISTQKDSFTCGYATSAFGQASVSFGYESQALGDTSIAMGYRSFANGEGSVAMGSRNTVDGNYSFVAGNRNYAIGSYANALGINCSASQTYSTAIGYSNLATGVAGFAIGGSNTASGVRSLTTGNRTTAAADNSCTFGELTYVIGSNSIAMGYKTTATGSNSLAGGQLSHTKESYSIAWGNGAVVEDGANGGVAFGHNTIAWKDYGLVFGEACQAYGLNSFAGGNGTIAVASNSVALGTDTTCNGLNSFTIGDSTSAITDNAMAIGKGVVAKNQGTFNRGSDNFSTVGDGQVTNLTFYGTGTSVSAVNCFVNGTEGLKVEPSQKVHIEATVLLSETGSDVLATTKYFSGVTRDGSGTSWSFEAGDLREHMFTINASSPDFTSATGDADISLIENPSDSGEIIFQITAPSGNYRCLINATATMMMP